MAVTCGVHKLVADIAIRAGDRVLFVKYKDVSRYDGQRGWFLPHDYLGHLEHPDEAAKRIATTQTGLTSAVPKLSHIESFGNGAASRFPLPSGLQGDAARRTGSECRRVGVVPAVAASRSLADGP